MKFFSNTGRRIPTSNMRVFGDIQKNYYRIDDYEIDYGTILSNSIKFGEVNQEIDPNYFQSACQNLKHKFEEDKDFNNLFNGVCVPFICNKKKSDDDLGRDLQDIELPNLQRAFNAKYPDNHFKAILQSDSKLAGNIEIEQRSRYKYFTDVCKTSTIIGWYFPQALQQFDIESQRQQMIELPANKNICLSGGIDIIAALIGSPHLLLSESNYTPILCLSSYLHSDPRLVLLIKSYGPHIEFWCMTQMLTSKVKQVSEQWAGGITLFDKLN